MILLIDFAIVIGTVFPTFVIGFCCYIPVGILLAFVVLGTLVVNRCTSGERRSIHPIENLHEFLVVVVLYIPFGIIMFSWWLASIPVIIGPLLIYLLGMLVTNTLGWSYFEFSDFYNTFCDIIFHVPMFLHEALIPNSS